MLAQSDTIHSAPNLSTSELMLKSVNDGNDDEVNAENDDAPGALN